MVTNYCALLAISLLGAAVGVLLAVLGTVFIKKWFLKKQGGIVVYLIFLAAFVSVAGLGVRYAVPCVLDLSYVADGTYEEEVGLVMGFEEAKYDADGNGRVNYSRPIFYFEATGETLVLPVKDVEIGKHYLVRYYPHTRIAEAVEVLP